MHAGARILYIDDDAGLARLAARVLGRRGYAVTTANSGAEGLKIAAAERFDLVAVDHYMPEMDGLETMARLHALPEAPPVVYVTGSEESRVAVAALKAGAADYVVKTIGDDFFDLLVSTFDQVLDRSRLEREKSAAEEQLRAGNERLAALLREVNHRVANSLQMVSAMVRLQAGATSDPGARDALEDTQTRIAAIAQVHRRLYTSDDVQQIDMREYLAAMIEELGETWSTPAAPRTLRLTAEPILLATDRAVSLGVIVNELVSNACKYAYPASGPGEVRVALGAEGDRFTLAVEDDGCGIDLDAAPRGTGVGTKLIRAMAQSLQSAVLYDAREQGTRATLTAALI
ncbi:sensor histidine kinase [Sphingomonas aracearum]|uniref:histidine kinase n=1 Tax=Sphingomonas aracearum TaxID=2283317 RepID=A0A369VU15_9SPHN|nr:response regulator [Sphingomonas aracearum]RDE04562.1 response regulator [Sphingomonas aracearum]